MDSNVFTVNRNLIQTEYSEITNHRSQPIYRSPKIKVKNHVPGFYLQLQGYEFILLYSKMH